MVDSFFDLGKQLPKLNATSLRAHLDRNDEVFESSFEPSSTFDAPTPGDTIQIKGKTFKRMRFYETHFIRVVFTQCTFDECLFLGAHFEECAFHKCVFIKCNTNKFRLSNTYIDPRSFLDHIFDKRKYANVGVDLFHTLLKNSADESQPEFRDIAEYHFRKWQRYNRVSYWRRSVGKDKWLNGDFYAYWIWNRLYQLVFGFGVRTRNIAAWTPIIATGVWTCNYVSWGRMGINASILPETSTAVKAAFFTVGNLTAFGTAELTPTTEFGLIAVSGQVVLGIAWIAVCTAMIVRRLIR